MTRSPQHHPHPASAPAGASVPASLPARRPFAALLLAAPFAFAGAAQAATITVTTGDVSQNTACHLIDAITAANTDAATGGCAAGSGADTIVIADGITTTLTAVNNDRGAGANGLPVITSEVRIEANGNIIERSTAVGTPQFRLLEVGVDGALTVRGAVLRGGSATSSGGAIFVSALSKLRLEASTVTGNTATSVGGGIATSNNTSGSIDTDVQVQDSLISNNTAVQGGGAYLRMAGSASRIAFSNVTVHGNVASSINASGGGGLWIVGASTASAVVNHVTVTSNRAGNGVSNGVGGGLAASGLSIKNSLICGNEASNAVDFDGALRIASPVISLGGNLVGCVFTDRSSFPNNLTRVYTPAASDLLLGNGGDTPTPSGSILESTAIGRAILKDNGGPTHTVALVAGSPAINPVRSPTDDLPLRRDQRGYVPNGAATPPDTIRDIGAFEFEGVPPVAPAAPTALAATPADGSLTIAFTPGAAGTAPITNYAYALGESTTFTALDPVDGESPVTITGLTNGTALTVRLKAISEDGESAASESVTGTPAAVVNGACGAATSKPTATAPAEQLCSSGTATAVGGSNGAWRWLCTGTGGGSIASCAAAYTQPTITLTADPTTITVGDEGSTVFASSTSGAKPVLTSTTPSVCALGPVAGSPTGTTMTASGITAGTCTVKATLAGTGDVGDFRYLAASDQTVDITVNKGAQTITGFAADPSALKVGGMATLSATGGASGNAVTFSSLSSDICFVSGSTVTALAVGNCTVTANQAGSADFEAAEPAMLTIGIEAADVATGPVLKLDMNDLDFGTGYLLRFRDIGVETTSEAEVVTLSNTGSAPLAISSIVTTGDFRHTTSCGVSVAPGASCTISIRFTPKAVGTRTGETRIVSNAVSSPDRISLSGTGKGLQPAIKTNVSSFDFGRVRVGATSLDRTLVITSSGSGPLEIRSITVTGDYTGSHNCPRWLDAGKSCQVTGRFRPRTTGVRPGAVSILTSVSSTPTQVTLTGTGTSGGTVN